MNIDVVIVTYGEPQTNSFLEHWRYSNRILMKLTRLVAPIPKFIVPVLGARRGLLREKLWRKENYKSPLEILSSRQVGAVRAVLANRSDNHLWRVHLAFEFRNPLLVELLDRIRNHSCERLVLVPMYVAISDFTMGISHRDFEAYQKKNGHPFPKARSVAFRPCHRELGRVMANHIRKQLSDLGFTAERCKQAGLLLGCHGTVVKPPRGIADAGYCDTQQAYDDLEEELRGEFQAMAIGWLNHRLGGEWTTPTLETSARRMREQGIKEYVYFPFGFLADNAETQLEGRIVLRKLGIETYHHLPCLNDNPAFIDFLVGRIVVDALK